MALAVECEIAARVWFHRLHQIQQRSRPMISLWFLGRSELIGILKSFTQTLTNWDIHRHQSETLLSYGVLLETADFRSSAPSSSLVQETMRLLRGTVAFIVKMSRAAIAGQWRYSGTRREDQKVYGLWDSSESYPAAVRLGMRKELTPWCIKDLYSVWEKVDGYIS